jgi:hypothetical protein
MIDRRQLLSDLQDVLETLEADLLERSESGEVPAVGEKLRAEYERAKSAQRTAQNYEDWRSDAITQSAAAWVLSCVFVRFLEDNGLIAPPKIAGPLASSQGDQLQRARDEHELYFRQRPRETDREYLLSVFDELARLPGTKDVFGEHNPIHELPNWLSGDAAGELLRFFQRIDADTGALVHDFADPTWDTRFLGDLYQDLSEAARKKFALLQTPEFVEEFILDRTLDPALEEFGLGAAPVKDQDGKPVTEPGFRMIDPACGSGHFLLGAFPRLLSRWQKNEPGTNVRMLVQRALDSIHGVDVNPYAVAIARFRLLLAAMRASDIRRLTDCPAFQSNLACGDSLLHAPLRSGQQVLDFELTSDDEECDHAYQSEDLPVLKKMLRGGQYHTVVANPPYITPKDRQLNERYRRRFLSCHRQYSLAVPFLERIFRLAVPGGYTGQITANSFMKREFGKKLIESFIPTIDLTHVIDTSGGGGAYIPGHTTGTVILFGRNWPPISGTIRAVMGIRGEPSTPANPARGLVWSAIVNQVDLPGSRSEFISVADSPRELFHKHPWSIGGGGAAELKQALDETATSILSSLGAEPGIASWAGIDEVCVVPLSTARRMKWESDVLRSFITGDVIRDWTMAPQDIAACPYDEHGRLLPQERLKNCLGTWWLYRSHLNARVLIGGDTFKEQGIPYYGWVRLIASRYHGNARLVFSFIATHNHFVLDRGGNVFNRSAPIITLPSGATDDAYFVMLGLLNTAIACFWMKQVFYPKATSSGDISIEKGKPEANRYEYSVTGMERFPIPFAIDSPEADLCRRIAAELDAEATRLQSALPESILSACQPDDFGQLRNLFLHGRESYSVTRERMIALQEELDWEGYRAFGVSPVGASEHILNDATRGIPDDARPFLWRNETVPDSVPETWRDTYECRRRLLSSAELSVIETPVFKRPWWGRQGVYGRLSRDYEGWTAEALVKWLLGRLESYFDFDGRLNSNSQPRARLDIDLLSIARLADVARQDTTFMQVGELYRDDPAFDVHTLIAELVNAECVPLLPILRNKASGLRKRAEWETTWELQRCEDELAAQRQRARQRMQTAKDRVATSLTAEKADIDTRRQALWDDLKNVRDRFAPDFQVPNTDDPNVAALMLGQHGVSNRAALEALEEHRTQYAAKAREFDSKIYELCKIDAGYQAAVRELESIPEDPEIAVPPKYTSADFQNSNYWRLRGKLDVPKERWVTFPHCEGPDGTLVIAWAGYDHLQLARAISAYFIDVKERLGGADDPRLVPLLACLIELLPWLKQWHNEPDAAFDGLRMGDYFEGFVTEEARALGKTIPEIKAWTPPARTTRRKRATT